MKRWQRVLSFYLVLCVVFASAVGISPQLHLWIEHGGQGHAHSHAAFYFGESAATEHVHPHPHPHAVLEQTQSRNDLERLFAEKYPQPKLFGVELKDVYRAIGGVITRAFEHLPTTPSHNDGPGHTHHSLAQMLLSGTVEGISDVPPLVVAPTVLTFSAESSSALFVASIFDAQTASRGPPAVS